MASQEDLIKNVKGWLTIDEEIKELQKSIREKKKELNLTCSNED